MSECDARLGSAAELTRLIEQDLEGTHDLAAMLYSQLRQMAATYFGQQAGNHTLQPTAVVHEAFVRLAGGEEPSFEGRRHFLCVASKAMRHVLVDHARRKKSDKRGGDWRRVTLEGIGTGERGMAFDAGDVGEALDRLDTLSERQAQIVELRFFGGLRVEDIAALLGVSERTIRNEWRVARAWLRTELDGEPGA